MTSIGLQAISWITVSFCCFELWYPDLLPLVLTLAMMVNLLAFLFLPLLSWLLLGLYNHTFCLLSDGESNLLQHLWKAEHRGLEQSKFFQLHFITCHWNLPVPFFGYIPTGLVNVLRSHQWPRQGSGHPLYLNCDNRQLATVVIIFVCTLSLSQHA